jgi:4'-phosphopantetheinyl transferase
MEVARPASMELIQQCIPAWHPPAKTFPDLDSETAHIWRIPLDESLTGKVVSRCRRILAPEEIERAKAFRSPAQGNQFILYRGALRLLLSRYTRYWAGRIRYSYGANGKPTLKHPRFFPSGTDLEFSVSNSGDFALVGVTRGRPFGLDIERIRPIGDATDQVARFFTSNEKQDLADLPHEHRIHGFFNGWTRKKAFVRALGEGFAQTMPRTEVTLKPGTPSRLKRHALLPGDEARWMMFSFEPAPGYTAAIAIKSTRTDLSFRDFSFDC